MLWYRGIIEVDFCTNLDCLQKDPFIGVHSHFIDRCCLPLKKTECCTCNNIVGLNKAYSPIGFRSYERYCSWQCRREMADAERVNKLWNERCIKCDRKKLVWRESWETWLKDFYGNICGQCKRLVDIHGVDIEDKNIYKINFLNGKLKKEIRRSKNGKRNTRRYTGCTNNKHEQLSGCTNR